MSRREQAVGKNEALFRKVNERIREITTYDGDAGLLYECGDPTCARPISLGLDEYEDDRSVPTQFLIVPGHEAEDFESVIRTTDRFALVRKREGVPAEIAADLDPRS